MPACQARQHSDQMLYGRCGLGWDANDPEPPPCAAQPAPMPEPSRVPALFRRDRGEMIDAARGITWRKP